MLVFARSNTISTQTTNTYLNQLQWNGQFALVYMLLEVLSLEIYPNVSVINSFPSVPHIETDRQRSISVVSINPPRPDRRPPDTASVPPLRNTYLPSQADECKTLAYDLLELSQRPHSCNDLSLRNSDAVQWFFDINIWKYTGTYRHSIHTISWVKDVIQGFAQVKSR